MNDEQRDVLESGEAASSEERSHEVLFCRNQRMGEVKQHNTHRERERVAQRGITLLSNGPNLGTQRG